MKARGKNRRQLIEILDKVLVTKTRDEWMHILKHGGDFIYTVVNSIDDQADTLVSRTSPMFFLRPNSAPNSGRFPTSNSKGSRGFKSAPLHHSVRLSKGIFENSP